MDANREPAGLAGGNTPDVLILIEVASKVSATQKGEGIMSSEHITLTTSWQALWG